MRFWPLLILSGFPIRAFAQSAPAADQACVHNYQLDLNGLSLEGGTGYACVGEDNRVRRAVATLFAETGKVSYAFIFRNDSAFTSITEYRYLRPLPEVRSGKDMKREPVRNLQAT